MRYIGTFLFILLFSLPAPAAAQLFKDSDARAGVEELRRRLNEVESALQVRQMGLGEQIQSIREDNAVLQSMIEENRRENDLLGNRIDVTKIETQEALVQLNRDYQERFAAINENAKRLLGALEDFQKNLATLGQNLQTLSDYEKGQEERIAAGRQQVQEQIRVVVEEVSGENQRLQNSLSVLRQDIADITAAINTLDGRVRGLDGRIRQVGQRLDTMARPPAAAATSADGDHIVQQGETLSIIAQLYGVTVQQIMDANGLGNPNLINIGQALIIPAQ